MKILVGISLILLIVVLAAILALRNQPAGSVARLLPSLVTVDTAKPPLAMEIWVSEMLERNGLPASDTSRLHRSGKAWVVDFRGLPVWSLLEERPYVSEYKVGLRFPDTLRIEGAMLCGDLPAKAVLWLDRTAPGWKSTQHCSGADQQELLETWLKTSEGRVALVGSGKDGKGMISRLHLRCKDSKTAFPLGGLLPLRDLRSLELERCRFGEEQIRLEHLPLERLVLHGHQDSLLNTSAMTRLDTLAIEGGSLSWLDIPQRCPAGREDCPIEERMTPRDLRLSRIPLCDPRLDTLLAGFGALRDSMLCQDYPREWALKLFDLQSTISLVDSEPPDIAPRGSILPGKYLERLVPKSKALWIGAEPYEEDCFDHTSKVYRSSQVRAGRDWIEIPRWGTFYFGAGSLKNRHVPDIGTSYQTVLRRLPAPFLEYGGFLVWNLHHGDLQKDDPSELQLILHFQYDADSSRVDAIWIPSGCWQSGWGNRYDRKWRKAREAEAEAEAGIGER